MNPDFTDDLREEYSPDLIRSGVRGKYATRYKQGSNAVVIVPDLTAAFPTSKAVNDALRDYLLKKRRPAT